MSEKLRILITGFGPFPGAPFNPTMPLVATADAACAGPLSATSN